MTMQRLHPIAALCLLLLFLSMGITENPSSLSLEPQKKDPWSVLLDKHVDDKGFVDYRGFRKDRSTLDEALDLLREQYPGAASSDKERIAYWINVYNAFTIDLVLRNYPLESIMDIDKAFDRKFIDVGGKSLSLNDVEKGILLEEFDDARVHYAVNCASVSCPPLRSEPYRAEKLDDQLHEQAVRFINDREKNRLSEEHVRVSKLYDWYEDDFTRNGSLIGHLNRYAKGVKIADDAKKSFLEYDWGLNESP